jgi:hypothetical protein
MNKSVAAAVARKEESGEKGTKTGFIKLIENATFFQLIEK